jgi:hypothetical protein
MAGFLKRYAFYWSKNESIYVVVPTAVGVGAPDVAKAFLKLLKLKLPMWVISAL